MDNQWIKYTICAGFLIICSVTDLRSRQISLKVSAVFAAGTLIWNFTQGGYPPAAILADLTPGIVLLLLGYATGRSIGYGDGIAVLVIGMLLGAGTCFFMTSAGLLLSALLCVPLCLLRKVNRKTQIPYMPFLTAALVLVILGNGKWFT